MIDFTKNDDLNKIVSDNDIAIIQYGSATCMPCHSIVNVNLNMSKKFKIKMYSFFIGLLEKIF